jgi:hypothetical protein
MFIGAEDIKDISPTQKVGEISVSDLELRIAKMEKLQKIMLVISIITIIFNALKKK